MTLCVCMCKIIITMGKLLAIDLDGTLFYPKSNKNLISKKNIQFLQDFIDAGNRVVFVTSRPLKIVDYLKEQIQRDFDALICSSARIYAHGEIIRDIPMNRDSLKGVFTFLEENVHPIGYFMTTKEHPLLIKQVSKISGFNLWMYKIYLKLNKRFQEDYVLDINLFNEELENGNIYKVMIFYGLGRSKKKISKEINKVLRENYPGIESSWSIIVNELTPLNCNKGDGLEYYCNYEGINKDDVYVIGDSGNDIAMFNKFHEHSYVMAHAYPSVKKYAKHTVTRVYKLRKYVLKGEED